MVYATWVRRQTYLLIWGFLDEESKNIWADMVSKAAIFMRYKSMDISYRWSTRRRSGQSLGSLRSGLLLFLAGRLPVHFSTVFPLERRDMVMGGAAERRLQASHRHRCTWWRAMVPPWCIHSLVRSLVCRVDRRPAAASDLHRWLGGRCELPHEDDWVSSAGSRAQQTTC